MLMNDILEIVCGVGVILHVYFIGIYYSIVEFFHDSWSVRSNPYRVNSKFYTSLREPVAVVTGGSGTIGKQLLKLLINQGFTVINLSYSDESRTETKHLINLTVDLTDLAYVKKIGQQITDSVDKVNLVICNAGIMFAPNKMQDPTIYSVASFTSFHTYEIHMALHLLGHAVLIEMLNPALISANGQCRVIFVASSTAFAGYLDYDYVHTGAVFKEYVNGYWAYAKSKLAECCYAEQLDWFFVNECKSQKPVARVCSLHPGCVAGHLYSNSWLPARILINYVFSGLLRSSRTAAEEILSTALSDDFIGGSYYERHRPYGLLRERRIGVVTRRELFNQVKSIIYSL